MEDCIQRVIAESGRFFGVACNTTQLVEEGCRRHDVGPLAAAALGRAMTGAALLAALMKDEQSLMLKFEGNGPLGKVLAEAGYDGWVRGYVAEPHADLPLFSGRIDVAGGIGHAGVLTVTKTIASDQRYPGTIPLASSEIGEDIAWYLSQSEQTPSTVAVSVSLAPDGRIVCAGGFLIQSLPPADEADLGSLEAGIAALPPLSSLLADGVAPAEILSRIFADVPHRTLHSRELEYQCNCSAEKMKSALLTLGRDDLLKLADEREEVEVRCEFCRRQWLFSAAEIRTLAGSFV